MYSGSFGADDGSLEDVVSHLEMKCMVQYRKCGGLLGDVVSQLEMGVSYRDFRWLIWRYSFFRF